MHNIEIIIIAFGLAMDAFTVSICAGANGKTEGIRPVFRLSFHFGLFQFLMPVAGWYFGSHISEYISNFDHWIAFILLSYVGIKMIKSGRRNKSEVCTTDFTRGKSLILLSIATSIDALAIGLSLGVLNVDIWYPAIIIGLITSGLSLIGIKVGTKLGISLGGKMEIIGGIFLILIGLKILAEHIFFL